MPFSLPEMLARVNALLRRTIQSGSSGVLSFGDVVVDRSERRVRRGKSPPANSLVELVKRSGVANV